MSQPLACRLAALSAVLFIASAPAQQQRESRESPVVVEAKRGIDEVKNVPSSPGAPVDPKSYKLGAEDVIFVRVWREPELSGPLMIRPDGKITMPLIGELQAAGQTPEELAKAITEALSKVMKRPEVFIQVTQVNSKKYYISGEVNRVGAFPLVTPITVLEAISAAGGLREFANGSKITIIRGTKRFKFNYKDVVKGKNLDQNIYLENGDHIIVP